MPQPTTWTDDRASCSVVQVPIVSVARTEARDATHGMRKLATIVGKLLWLAEVSLRIATDGAGGLDVRWMVLDLGPHPDGRCAGLSLPTPPAGVEAGRWATVCSGSPGRVVGADARRLFRPGGPPGDHLVYQAAYP